MKTFMLFTILACLVFDYHSLNAQLKSLDMEDIDVGGLILDSETLKPIGNANVFDEHGQKLAVTNSDGYFKMKLSCSRNEEVKFTFEIKKDDYISFKQEEHWGAPADNMRAIFYVGLKRKESKRNSFSEMVTEISDVSFPTATKNLENIKAEIALENKIEDAKNGNEKVFFEIDGRFYIVSSSGWIKLNSKEDNISINGKKVVLAPVINSLITRESIKGMTPIVSDVASFRIDTMN